MHAPVLERGVRTRTPKTNGSQRVRVTIRCSAGAESMPGDLRAAEKRQEPLRPKHVGTRLRPCLEGVLHQLAAFIQARLGASGATTSLEFEPVRVRVNYGVSLNG